MTSPSSISVRSGYDQLFAWAHRHWRCTQDYPVGTFPDAAAEGVWRAVCPGCLASFTVDLNGDASWARHLRFRRTLEWLGYPDVKSEAAAALCRAEAARARALIDAGYGL